MAPEMVCSLIIEVILQVFADRVYQKAFVINNREVYLSRSFDTSYRKFDRSIDKGIFDSGHIFRALIKYQIFIIEH